MAYNLSTNEWDPLFYALFKEAIPQMEGYQSDLGHDTLMLSHASVGDRFLWGVRKTGTELKPLPEDHRERSALINEMVIYFNDHRWYLITVTNKRDHGYCAGVLDPLPYGEPASDRSRSDKLIAMERALHEPLLDPMHYEKPYDAPFSDGSRPSDPYVCQDNDKD